MSEGIKITLKNGKVDYIDPVVDVVYEKEMFWVDNGYHQYDYLKADVLKTERYTVGEADE